MIGNWYQWYAEGKYYFFKVTEDTFMENKDTIASFEPIQITEEILEKNGFVKKEHVYPYPYYEYEFDNMVVGYAFPIGDNTSYKDNWIMVDSESIYSEHLPCKYVHQLQNFFRICGIEKDIELL